jgi:micrococcal nuclease
VPDVRVRLKPHPLLLSAIVLLAAAGCSTGEPKPTTLESLPVGESAIVDYVTDGDTLRVRSGERIRLLQIDAPELHGDCYGKAARAALERLAPPGATVTLVRDRALDSTDAYGRRLRYVFARGTNVNLALVSGGAASPYFFRGERGRYARQLLAAVKRARAARRGYWGACPHPRLNVGLGSLSGPA